MLKNITKDELKNAINDHSIYLKYGGKEGKRLDLSGTNLRHLALRDVDFTDANLKGANFTSATFDSADFTDANLKDANFTSAAFTGADFTDANLKGANFTSATFPSADFTDANLKDANFTSAAFTSANFTDANLKGADFTSATFPSAAFTSANFTSANFTDANLKDANFSGVDLSGADLSGAYLSRAIGDGQRIRTIQLEHIVVTWDDMLAVGPDQHPIEKWKTFDRNWFLRHHDENHWEWWAANKNTIFCLLYERKIMDAQKNNQFFSATLS